MSNDGEARDESCGGLRDFSDGFAGLRGEPGTGIGGICGSTATDATGWAGD
jgi:hypothetical protein